MRKLERLDQFITGDINPCELLLKKLLLLPFRVMVLSLKIRNLFERYRKFQESAIHQSLQTRVLSFHLNEDDFERRLEFCERSKIIHVSFRIYLLHKQVYIFLNGHDA